MASPRAPERAAQHNSTTKDLPHRSGLCARPWQLAAISLAALVMVGCSHSRRSAYAPPAALAPTAAGADQARDEAHGPPSLVETGLASWYGPNYNHHHAADGTTYDQDALTAAHRTLPLGSIVRVTNLTNGLQVYVRITDRGPFAPGRVLDLSKGAAQSIDMVRAGVARVRLEAWPHRSADPAGRWAVQTGAFHTEEAALDLKAALIARYRGARVTEFHGPTGYWVRADPALHDRQQAEAMLDWIGKPDPNALPYLVRLD